MSSTDDARAAAAQARADLEQTLDAIEDKLNVPKRIGEVTKKAEVAYRDNPLPFVIGGAVAAITTVGLIAWGIFGGKRD
ncbi:DUF3618 domain-containing protein [Schumannella soli]|uniref:DUF3618 domain-containing protein n=1 Tax=Schumannella soli TaxID=2590779 RepID=A0A506YA38_9MICO|nr:DUF3618 domain-containing protein [Schumannella soli]TPW77967.1 DUF3618 domain-containing protein [Schumannella soli]